MTKFKNLKTIFDWETYPEQFKNKWYPYIDEEFERREKGPGQISLHVGYKHNRAKFFSADNYHSPLQWSGNGSVRYSINNFFV